MEHLSTEELLEIVEENRALRTLLEARNKELSTLRGICDAVARSDEAPDVRDAKIVQLSKKNRGLNVAVEKERMRAAKLKAELETLQQQVVAEKENKLAKPGISAEAAEALSRALHDSKEKLAQANTRLMEAQAGQRHLTLEVARLQRALVREVGEDASIEKVLKSTSSDWRGRAQTISLLKDKVKELKGQVQEKHQHGKCCGSAPASEAPTRLPSAAPRVSATAPAEESASASTSRAFAEGHRAQLDALDKDRRRESERLAVELSTARDELGVQRQKLDACTARKNNLEAEVRLLKEKMAVVLNKADNDDRLIAMLRTNLAAAKRALNVHEKASGGGDPHRQSTRIDAERLAASHSQLKHRCSQLEVQVERQEELIRNLQDAAVATARASPALSDAEREVRKLRVEKEKLRGLVEVLKRSTPEANKQR